MANERSLASLTAEDFRAHLGTGFGLAGGRFESELIEVSDLGEAPEDGSRAPFSLVFRSPLGVSLGQGIHRVEHPELGHLDVFLVPIGPDEVGMRYEAVFG